MSTESVKSKTTRCAIVAACKVCALVAKGWSGDGG